MTHKILPVTMVKGHQLQLPSAGTIGWTRIVRGQIACELVLSLAVHRLKPVDMTHQKQKQLLCTKKLEM